MSVLIVAEKPSVGHDIARVLGARAKNDGYLEGNGYIVTWAFGHLVTLMDPGEIDEKWLKWRQEDLPMLPESLPTKVIAASKKQYEIVRKLMLSAEVTDIICATDSGREGEYIFRLIYEKAGCHKPVRRLWISSMTDAAIKQGFADLKPSKEYDALYLSARCRSESDWLVGMNASRAFTIRYGALLSVGRVQTPTLALIVRRDKQIESFVPRDYWELQADFGDYKGLWEDPKTKELRSFDKETLEKAASLIEGQTAVVTESVREKKRMQPPQLYDLTSLQRDANVRFGFSAQKTLDITQALYERHKLLTYPRTDSRCLPDDMAPKMPKLLESVEGELAPFAQKLLPQPPRPKRVYDNSKISDHHAIVLTGTRVGGKNLSADERKIFDLVSRRMIASLYPDYEYESARILTQCQGHTFRSNGTTPLKDGWRALYPNDKKEEETLPQVGTGETCLVKGTKIAAKKEKAPPRMTTASLLQQMEQAGKELDNEELRETMKDSGLGTPATRAAIIERLIHVGYVKTVGKTLQSTEKGRNLIAVMPQEMISAETTGKWERALNKMARMHSYEEADPLYTKFMGSIRRYSAFLVSSALTSTSNVVFEKEAYKPKRRTYAKKTAAAGVKPAAAAAATKRRSSAKGAKAPSAK